MLVLPNWVIAAKLSVVFSLAMPEAKTRPSPLTGGVLLVQLPALVQFASTPAAPPSHWRVAAPEAVRAHDDKIRIGRSKPFESEIEARLTGKPRRKCKIGVIKMGVRRNNIRKCRLQ